MEQIIFGIILIGLGIVSFLEAVNLVDVVSWWRYVSPLLVALIGLYLVLRAHSRMTIRRKDKQINKLKNQEIKE